MFNAPIALQRDCALERGHVVSKQCHARGAGICAPAKEGDEEREVLEAGLVAGAAHLEPQRRQIIVDPVNFKPLCCYLVLILDGPPPQREASK